MRTSSRSLGFLPRMVVAIVVLIFVAACGPMTERGPTVSNPNADAAQVSSIQSRRDIERVLWRNMTTNEVFARLGPCSDIITFPDGALLWTYWLRPFREEYNSNALYVLAVRLSITNGRVEHVGYLRASEPRAGTDGVLPDGAHTNAQTNASTEPCLVTLSVVSSNQIDGERLVDSQKFPKLGYVRTTPEVTIAKLRTVVIETHSSAQPSQPGTPGRSFVIYLTEQDSRVIQSFTGTNVLRRILISVCGEPVAAPVLISPIDTGSLVFDCTDPVVAERLEQELTLMAREEPRSPHQDGGR